MTTIDFFTNAPEPLKLAGRIIAKAYRQHGSVRVLTPDASTTAALDRLLWLEPPHAFLPHCRMDSVVANETPIWIDETLAHTGPASVLVNLHPDPPPFFSRFERLAEVVGADDAQLAAGRARYRFYRERGYELKQHDWSRRD
ncbi:MAG TPA: DNA polymerase III subunit chi [Casimicrobiaceae bacterium]|nr:DNA polymerase III subunit chi [Casimicrobiaceae bacterium]